MKQVWGRNKESYLSKETTDCIKGIFALVVVMAHIRGQLPIFNNTMIGQLLTAAGYLSVAIFFFISGYGLQASYETKGKEYVDDFHKNRTIPFYVSYLIVLVIYLFFYIAIGKNGDVNTTVILRSVFLQGTLIQNGWYLETIIFFYILFWAGCRFVKKNNRGIILVLIGVFLYCVWCIASKKGAYSYVSAFAFPMGIVWCEFKLQIEHILEKKKNETWGLMGICVAFCVTLILGNIPFFIEPIMLMFRCFSAVLFVAFLLFVVRTIRINNIIFRFLGKISYEIYVFHGLFLLLYRDAIKIEKTWIYILTVMVSSIVFAYLIHPVMQKTNVLVKKCIG